MRGRVITNRSAGGARLLRIPPSPTRSQRVTTRRHTLRSVIESAVQVPGQVPAGSSRFQHEHHSERTRGAHILSRLRHRFQQLPISSTGIGAQFRNMLHAIAALAQVCFLGQGIELLDRCIALPALCGFKLSHNCAEMATRALMTETKLNFGAGRRRIAWPTVQCAT